ncbi:condensation protein [Leptospira semungkisensis]|uniref:Phthiocerol/phthiodiolone dimycocerosyl transferase n=1 Tax=Leptospira semungkisensis TaxID=2484985 RepID=A0A4V3JBE2_9LEPT|nr:condensation protein [Leptospira semungkisensis]
MQNLQEPERLKTNFLRSLDQAEANFWLYDRSSSMNFSVMLEGEGNFSEEQFRKGLDYVQSKHVLAKAQILKQVGEDSHLYFARSEKKIPIQKEKYSSDWKTKLAKETIRLFSLEDSPLIRAILYESEGSKFALGIIFHHSMSDGRSGCHFLLDVVKASFSEEEVGVPTEPIEFSSLMDLYPAEELYKSDKKSDKPLSVPQFQRKNGEADPQIVSLSIEEDKLTSLIQNVKQKGMSVHGFLGAVQITAFSKFFPKHQEGVLYLSTPVDLRPYLSHTVPDSALGLYISLFTTIVDLRDSFQEKAMTVIKDIKARLAKREGRAFYELLPPPEQFLEREDGMRVFNSLMIRNPQSSVISNVGIIPDLNIEGLKVKELSFTVHPALTQKLFTTVTTFENKMTINMNFDRSRWKTEDMDLFVSSFEDALYKNSGLNR